MNFVDTNICVGGPLDGQRYAAPPEARYFRVYDRPKLPSMLDFDPSKPRSKKVQSNEPSTVGSS